MKIKKLLIATIFTIGVVNVTSCKKAYSCECKTTYTTLDNLGDDEIITLTTVEPLSEKMKEKQANASCAETQNHMTVVNKDLNEDPNGTYEDLKSTCTVK